MVIEPNGFVLANEGNTHAVRLDSALQIDEADKPRKWIFGDAISGSRSWSRSVRFAGVQLATDFSLRPDLNTMPLPSFFGQAVVPSNVDVFVNSARVFESQIDAGPFEINNLPVVTGNGGARMVIRDALGRETIIQLPYYASQSLLRQGLSSYDFNAGVLRRGYGDRSFDYGDMITSGSYSFGFNSVLTLEGHGEAAREVQMLGAGALISLAPYGVMHPAIASSRSSLDDNSGLGKLYSLSFEGNHMPVGYFGSLALTDGNYNDNGSLDGARPPRMQAQIGSNIGFGDNGAFAASFISTRQNNQDMTHITTASYTLPFAQGINIGTAGLYDHTRHEFIAQAFLSIRLGGDYIGNANVQRSGHAVDTLASVTKQVNPDGGVGYQLSASTGQNEFQEADVTWIGSKGSVSGSLAARQGTPAARFTASGGVAVIDGAPYLIRQPSGAVALVRTGKPGIDVYQENRPIAVSDAQGEALISGLIPFADNHIAIDPTGYSIDTLIEETEKTIVPPRGSVIVDFTPTHRVPAVVKLQLPDGGFPPAGSAVILTPQDPTQLSPSAGVSGILQPPLIMGHRGQLFVPDLSGSVEGAVQYGKGSCVFSVSMPSTPGDQTDTGSIGPIFCKPARGL